jgi:hypothetical protein
LAKAKLKKSGKGKYITIGIGATAAVIVAVMLSALMSAASEFQFSQSNDNIPQGAGGPQVPAQFQPPSVADSPADQMLAALVPSQLQNFQVSGDSVFPNQAVKQNIVKGTPSTFTIDNVHRSFQGYNVDASNVKVQLIPASQDGSKTKVYFVIQANSAKVTGGTFGLGINKSFNNLNINSISGVYDKSTGKIDIHVPPGLIASLLFK